MRNPLKNNRRTIRFLDSPHHNERPKGLTPDLLVLHAISLPPGKFESQYIEDFFMGSLDTSADPSLHDLKGVRVSAHFVVNRQGIITQFVPLHRRAWHAGKSSWQEKGDCNNYSIGIEMIGDEIQPFTNSQYRETARLCRTLMQSFPNINKQRIVGHQDIAPGRKWDPGKQWEWGKFHRSLSRIRNLDIGKLK
ncbi:MAG: 1,6-anhydro-N-acetylmuramyl-L-alanine amidase AmpD [Mariprofundaceae bacterium]